MYRHASEPTSLDGHRLEPLLRGEGGNWGGNGGGSEAAASSACVVWCGVVWCGVWCPFGIGMPMATGLPR